MGLASLIGGAFITGIVLYIIFFFAWAYGGKNLFWRFWYRKQIPQAIKILNQLNQEYPKKTKDKKENIERELKLAKSGYNRFVINLADKLSETTFYKIYCWLDIELKKGTTKEQAERMLLEKGFNKKTIEKVFKKLNKESKKNGRKERSPNTYTGTDLNTHTRQGSNTDTNGTREGTDTRGSDRGSVETEPKRVLPPSKPATDEPDKHISEWDWASFSQNR